MAPELNQGLHPVLLVTALLQHTVMHAKWWANMVEGGGYTNLVCGVKTSLSIALEAFNVECRTCVAGVASNSGVLVDSPALVQTL